MVAPALDPAVHAVDVVAYRDRAGTLPGWARLAIVFACIATVALPAIGGHVLWAQVVNQSIFAEGAIEWGLALVAALAVAVAIAPSLHIGRGLQVAVLLPAIHVALIAIGWLVWQRCIPNVVDPGGSMTIGMQTSLTAAVGVLVAVGVVTAKLIARGRRDVQWEHVFALFGLVLLLAFGLWLPIASSTVAARTPAPNDPTVLAPLQLGAWMVATPTMFSIAYTAVAIRMPDRLAPVRWLLAIAFVATLLVGIGMRGNAGDHELLAYANFLPMLLATVLVACGGLALQVAMTAWRERALRQRLATEPAVSGTIVADGGEPVVAALEIAGWLRAPRTVVRPFTIATSDGAQQIPGARLATSVAPITTILAVGEATPIVSVGDTVVIVGLERVATDGPFRAHGGLIPGENIAIARADLPAASVADVAFATWRPTLAYLAILVAIALPALAAELSSHL